jgi:hypothetical protein
MAAFLSLIFSFVHFLLGLDRIIWSRASAEEAVVLLFSNGLSGGILLLVNSMRNTYFSWFPYPALPGEMLILVVLFTMFAGLFARYRLRLITAFASRWLNFRGGRGGFGERVETRVPSQHLFSGGHGG